MDALDRKIIVELQNDGRISVTELADRLPLSLSATSERLRRLLDSDTITGFRATVDPLSVGRPIEALIDVRFGPGDYTPDIDFTSPTVAGVIDAVRLTGRFDMQLRVSTRDVAELDRILEALKEDMNAEETNTRLILRNIPGFPRPVPVA